MGSWGAGVFDNDAAADLFDKVSRIGRAPVIPADAWDWAWTLVGDVAWESQTPETCSTSLQEEALALAVVLAELRTPDAWKRVYPAGAPFRVTLWRSERMCKARPAALDAWWPPLVEALVPVAAAQRWRTPEMARDAAACMQAVVALWPATVPTPARSDAGRLADGVPGVSVSASPVARAATDAAFLRRWADLWATGQIPAALGLWRLAPVDQRPPITPDLLEAALQSPDAAVRAAMIQWSAHVVPPVAVPAPATDPVAGPARRPRHP